MPDTFADRLKMLRTGRGLSVAALAAAAGLSRVAVYRYESGARKATWEVVQRLADALGTSTEELRVRADA